MPVPAGNILLQRGCSREWKGRCLDLVHLAACWSCFRTVRCFQNPRLSWRLSTLLVAAALCILLVAALAVGIAGPGLIRWCPSAARTSGRVAALGHLRHVRSLCMRLCITHGENHGAAQRQHHHDGDGILDPSFRNRFHIVDPLLNLVVLRDGCIIRQNA